MGKKVLITQSNYIPWKGYFDAINLVDECILYDDVQYTRRDWRNRNKIKTPQGTRWLTIPVQVKGRFHQKINETEISDPLWFEKHWASIRENYGRAPCFEEFSGALEELYFATGSRLLSEINFRFIRRISNLLGIKTRFAFSTDFESSGGKSERLVDLCKETGASEYYTGPSARAYLDEELFAREGIHLKYLDFSNYPAYSQLYGEFVHEVSILDLILNEGHNARRFMKSFSC